MKFILPLALVIIISNACGKSSDKPSHELHGKWKLTETMISPGSPVPFTAVDFSDGYVQFSSNGKFSSNKVMNPGSANRFRIIDDKKIELYKDGTADAEIRVFYEISGSTLILNFPCFEACGYKFVRSIGDR